MFIKEEYNQSLRAAIQKQIEAVFSLHRLMMNVSEERLFERLKDLCHGQAKLYCTYKDMIDSIHPSEQEKRIATRENSLGAVKVQETLSGDTAEAKCLDVSLFGMRLLVDTAGDINAGSKFNMWIDMLDKDQSMRKTGIVKWTQKMDDTRYQCGVQFV
ncbi:MAG: PilZ domain-containing protein [Candidatus Omnitrophica bacterium]|nr:PilZ domain-containing protein [Candidatus Omnitrophota bacterium]